MPTVKHSGGDVIVWGCGATAGPGQLAVIDKTIQSAVYVDMGRINLDFFPLNNEIHHFEMAF